MQKKLNDVDADADKRRTRAARDEGDAVPAMAIRTPGVARILGISERSAQRLISEGTLPSIRIGGMRLVRLRAVEKFLSSRESGSDLEAS
jgi:excisionase family DNA binding protein